MASKKQAVVRGVQAAQALRLREQLGFGPVDIWKLLERLGVSVGLRAFGDKAGDGLYLWEADEPFIVVNTSKRASRQRFTAAHELGHHEMHRFAADRVLFADEDILQSNATPEVEANAFAAYLLAPDEGITHALGGRHGGEVMPDVVVELMRTFGLSYEATTWRLVNAGIVSLAERGKLAETPMVEERLRRAGVDDEESLFPPVSRLPLRHIDDALRLYEDHVVTSDRLAELLDVTPQDALELAEARGIVPASEVPFDEDAVDALLKDA
jgi:Zn-dependent peptidase ImmA (M78 family)